MADRSRISRSINKFNTYIINTVAYLLAGTPTNWSRFGWTAAEIAAWQAFLAQWTPLYAAYSNRRGGYTTGVKDQLKGIIKQCVALCNSNHLLLSIQATRSVTITDLEMFNLPTTGLLEAIIHHNTARIAPATDLVYASVKPLGGGVVRCKCFADATKSGRAHKLKGFDIIEYRFVVIAQGAALPTDANAAGLTVGSSSRASFLLSTGTNNSGKVLCIFFRWAHSKHPNLDGPWSGCYTTTIL